MTGRPLRRALPWHEEVLSDSDVGAVQSPSVSLMVSDTRLSEIRSRDLGQRHVRRDARVPHPDTRVAVVSRAGASWVSGRIRHSGRSERSSGGSVGFARNASVTPAAIRASTVPPPSICPLVMDGYRTEAGACVETVWHIGRVRRPMLKCQPLNFRFGCSGIGSWQGKPKAPRLIRTCSSRP